MIKRDIEAAYNANTYIIYVERTIYKSDEIQIAILNKNFKLIQ